jgi:hydrogenase expression/formation protein HypE
MEPLPEGKITLDQLESLLERLPTADERVVVGPAAGEDAAVVDLGDRYLVVASDPITFAATEPGSYVVAVNANDVAVCGARPRWFLWTCCLPEGSADWALVSTLADQVGRACRALGVAVIGGHTEVSPGLERPILVGTMLGETEGRRLVTTAGAEAGDVLLLTKGVPLEGSIILATDAAAELRAKGVAEEVIERAASFLVEPGISVVAEALAAAACEGVTSMHDPTEGGLAQACHELARAAGVGVSLEQEAIPILDEGREICGAFGIDPLGTIASGALLIACRPEAEAALRRAVEEAGVAVAAVGRVTEASEGCLLVGSDGAERPLASYEQDELLRAFADIS